MRQAIFGSISSNLDVRNYRMQKTAMDHNFSYKRVDWIDLENLNS